MVNTRSLGSCSTILLRRREGGVGVSNWESAGGCSSFGWELADPSSESRDQKAVRVAQPSMPTKHDFCEKEAEAGDVGNVLRTTISRTSGGENFRHS
jgi:hypothetical protein